MTRLQHENEIVRGYTDAMHGQAPSIVATCSYTHGYLNRLADRDGRSRGTVAEILAMADAAWRADCQRLAFSVVGNG